MVRLVVSRSLVCLGLAVFGGAAVLGGCAHPRVATTTAARAPTEPEKSPLPDASGIWDWSFFSRDDQGDERFEREEWHIVQRGARLEGYYDRVVDMRSIDERLFRCNQKLSFTKFTRVRVAGRVDGNRVQIREVGFDAKPGPCDDGSRNLVEYRGVIAGGNLALRWGSDGGQTLVRRVDTRQMPLAESSGMFERGGATGDGATRQAAETELPAAALDGTWEWELRSIDAEGDERIEREEWHLTETSDGIRGYYDRTVKRVRGDATPFSCNGEKRFETATRYTVVGQRAGDRLMITEIDYKSEKTPCDNALRRLDTYHGKLSDPNTLILSWGPGNQLLRRRK
jgi:hypothetical protein